MASFSEVKAALGILDNYQDAILQPYYDEVLSYLKNAGIAESKITSGVVARGVADLWNYGSGEGKLSPYFYERATQLSNI